MVCMSAEDFNKLGLHYAERLRGSWYIRGTFIIFLNEYFYLISLLKDKGSNESVPIYKIYKIK